ncbi:MAG: hypothetical protein A2252_08285 [Elusimicrobia bacterium RIFOXYA2_FULL_39_19]|nr:MAG: hypothetical protein A2252_08285 [Elusimicrobia bacterium RIFOXYA2_FULL_39_19]
MTQRERFLKTMNFEQVDRVPDMEFGYWEETIERWYGEGLNHRVGDEGFNQMESELYFSLEQHPTMPVRVNFTPGFEEKILEDDGNQIIMQDYEGITYKKSKHGRSIPQFLKFPIENRQDWEKIKKEQLRIDDPDRYPQKWELFKKGWAKRDYPLGVTCMGLYGHIRNWMGVENASIAFALEPDLIHDMMEHLTELNIKVIERALNEVDVDFSMWWEDMCFNKGPLISPAMFQEFMVPRYKRITDFLAKHGVKINILDCDGKIDELVPGFLEGGINCMFPLESAHTDFVALRKKYGKKLLLMGGVNKMELMKGKAEIDKEIKRIEPVVREGGYIPHIDHRCPPDVSYENYLYYLEQKRKMIGRVGL